VVVVVVILVVVVVVILIVVIIVITMVAMMLAVFAMERALALIMPMDPVMVLPMPRYPYPQEALVPIARTIGVIGLIAQFDRDPDSHRTWPKKHANRQESHCKNREFRFHDVINDSYQPPALAASFCGET
jgi:hypothetical protein